ncbi:MFS transporter [Actinomycetota bacterium]
MQLSAYRSSLRIPQLRLALILGVMIRTPVAASFIILTLHVVGDLGKTYGQAGVLSAVATVCVAIAGPWRGRLLDRLGLRRAVTPSIIVLIACWSVAPFVGYWPLMGLGALASLFVVPVFSIVRQMILAAVPAEGRRTALSLDSMATEISFMVGPAFGVWACTKWDTSWVLFSVQMAVAFGCIVMWLLNPSLVSEKSVDSAPVARKEWMGLAAVAILAATAASTVVLAGSDVSVVAAMRTIGREGTVGPIMMVWAAGSLIGGFLYGLLRRPIRSYWILGALALATMPAAFAPGPVSLGALMFVAGLLCAPTLTATTEALTEVVPERARGEAMGWHGSAINAGSALGAPLAGFAIDHISPGAGFLAVATLGLAVAALGSTAQSVRRRRARLARVAA